MTSRHSGPAPATRGQWWFCGISVLLAVFTWAGTGGPGSSSSSSVPTVRSSQPAPDYRLSPDDHNYPNVRPPRLRDGGLTGGFCSRKKWC